LRKVLTYLPTYFKKKKKSCRGGGRYVKLVVLLYIEPTKDVGGTKGCILSNLPKVGGAIAPPAPPVPSPLSCQYKSFL